jgi:hypothetical protein
MLVLLLVALLAIILFGVGFSLHILWVAAVIVALFWLIGFVARSGGGRWYRW